MGRKLLLLNLLMVATIVLLAQQLVASWNDFQNEPRVFRPPPGADPPIFSTVNERNSPLGEFMVITERNLFSKHRGNELLETSEQEAEEPPEFAAQPQLISILSVRGEEQAILTVFSGRRGRDSENRTVKLGDDIEGYKVAEIGRDYLILRWKDVEEIIELTRGASASNTRLDTRLAVKIITVGAAAAAVETTELQGVEEAERGVLVGSVGRQQATGGRRGGVGQANTGSRNNLGGRGGRGNTNQNPRGLPGNVGVGSRRPSVQQSRPPE